MDVFANGAQVNVPARLQAGLAQCGEERLPILVIADNGFPPVAPIQHVIDRARVLEA